MFRWSRWFGLTILSRFFHIPFSLRGSCHLPHCRVQASSSWRESNGVLALTIVTKYYWGLGSTWKSPGGWNTEMVLSAQSGAGGPSSSLQTAAFSRAHAAEHIEPALCYLVRSPTNTIRPQHGNFREPQTFSP